MQSLIGKLYKFNARGPNEYDCLGLVQKYLEQQNIHEPFSDGLLIEHDWYIHQKYRLLRYMLKNYNRIKNPNDIRKNDIVIWEINGENHCGVAIDNYKRILTTYPGDRSCVIRLQNSSRFFCGIFRRKEGDQL